MLKTIKKLIQYPRLTQFYPQKKLDSSFFIGKPVIDINVCNRCEECLKRCPSSAIEKKEGSDEIGINYDNCIFCTLCEDVCPTGAVKMTTEFELAEKLRNSLRVNPLPVNDLNKSEENDLNENDENYEILGNKLKNKINEMFGRSLQIREVDSGSCNGCDYEINALNNPFNDIERFGIHFVASPRHADMLLVTGTASRNMELALLKTYEATPDPKLVVAVGACACSGGIFKDSYATKNGIDCILPVDVYIPGCPPRPQAIIHGILKALDKA